MNINNSSQDCYEQVILNLHHDEKKFTSQYDHGTLLELIIFSNKLPISFLFVRTPLILNFQDSPLICKEISFR